jgi:hypothetical protein
MVEGRNAMTLWRWSKDEEKVEGGMVRERKKVERGREGGREGGRKGGREGGREGGRLETECTRNLVHGHGYAGVRCIYVVVTSIMAALYCAAAEPHRLKSSASMLHPIAWANGEIEEFCLSCVCAKRGGLVTQWLIFLFPTLSRVCTHFEPGATIRPTENSHTPTPLQGKPFSEALCEPRCACGTQAVTKRLPGPGARALDLW